MHVGKRGAFIVFEGCDRSGKTTQSRHLSSVLTSKGVDIKQINFPDRTTTIGGMINAYLTNTQDLKDEVIHLLFSANRWECVDSIKKDLLAGTTVICDRYSYSGAAYSAAKGVDFDWCCAPDRGLLEPDAVFYLKANLDELTSRGSYGEERYEKLDFQRKVGEQFDRLYAQRSSYWHLLDASKSLQELQDQIAAVADGVLQQAAEQPLSTIK
ncbi:GH20447 [Drosophila grimshawi]|uniref:Thymidylate kinase n=2 Tax=Drosophila grimshawi TaxID=7222 RepID=B4J9G7_DROGR|nr:GH20447 [Drosophila grimshawi]